MIEQDVSLLHLRAAGFHELDLRDIVSAVPARIPAHLAMVAAPAPSWVAPYPEAISVLRRNLGAEPARVPGDVMAPDDAPRAVPGVQLLVDVPEAAAMLGISETALRSRESRGQLRGVAVRTGRRLQFHHAKLVALLEKRAR